MELQQESYTKKATDKEVGYEFCHTKGGASAESYTKKATDDDIGYEFCHTSGGA